MTGRDMLSSLLPDAAVSVAVCAALLVIQYTLAMPTEDARALAHSLLQSAPYVFAPFFVAVLTGASAGALWIVGNLSVVGALISGIVATAGTAVLYADVLDVLVWEGWDDVTAVGQFLRMAIASLAAAAVMLWARRRRRA